jgi:hypothetical protein
MGLLATSQFHFVFLDYKRAKNSFFSFQSDDGGRVVTSVVVWILFVFNETFCFGCMDLFCFDSSCRSERPEFDLFLLDRSCYSC